MSIVFYTSNPFNVIDPYRQSVNGGKGTVRTSNQVFEKKGIRIVERKALSDSTGKL
jgi:hypothetical protein